MELEVSGERVEQVAGMRLDGGRVLVSRSDHESRLRHARRGGGAHLLATHHGDEARARRRLAELAAPAIVHGGGQGELVDVELDQVSSDPLQRRRREEGRIGVLRLEPVVDLRGVLPRIVVGRDQHRDERVAGALPDPAIVGVYFVEPQALVAKRRTHLGREVGDFKGVEDVGAIRGVRHVGSSQ